MRKFKVIAYNYFADSSYSSIEFDNEFNKKPHGYFETADLVMRVREEGTQNEYEFSFLDVEAYTEIYNYIKTRETSVEPAYEDWDEGETYLCLSNDSLPSLDEIETLSGKDIEDEELTDKELRYIFNQILMY